MINYLFVLALLLAVLAPIAVPVLSLLWQALITAYSTLGAQTTVWYLVTIPAIIAAYVIKTLLARRRVRLTALLAKKRIKLAHDRQSVSRDGRRLRRARLGQPGPRTKCPAGAKDR
jgi:hypothetical protein